MINKKKADEKIRLFLSKNKAGILMTMPNLVTNKKFYNGKECGLASSLAAFLIAKD